MSKQYLYLMRNGLGLMKIGISSDPDRRRKELQASSGLPVCLVGVWETGMDAYYVEHHLHKQFDGLRVAGEWFQDITAIDIEREALGTLWPVPLAEKPAKPLKINLPIAFEDTPLKPTQNLIQQKGRTNWYVRLDCPSDVREELNCRVFCRSLQTDDLAVAQERRVPILKEWKDMIHAARARVKLRNNTEEE